MDNQPGVQSREDEEAKEGFGKLYEAFRTIFQEQNYRPWQDLSPRVQFLFAVTLADKGNLAHVAFGVLGDFIDFVSSYEASEGADEFFESGRND